jgi:hypothetical protein
LVGGLTGRNLFRQRITGLIRLCRQQSGSVDKLLQGVSGLLGLLVCNLKAYITRAAFISLMPDKPAFPA